MEKQDIAFSNSVMEIRKKAKKQKQVLMFARLSAEKGSPDDCRGIEKAKSKRTEEMKLA